MAEDKAQAEEGPREEAAEAHIDDGDGGAFLGAVYANRYNFFPGSNACRVVFGEVVPGTDKSYWRAAILIPTETLLQLADVIYETLGQKPQDDGK